MLHQQLIYSLCKSIIESGNYDYDYDSMLLKLDVFLLGNRITVEQYNELKEMMDNQQK